MELFYDVCSAYDILPGPLREIFGLLLGRQPQFAGFFLWMDSCNKTGNPQDMPDDTPERAEAQRSGCG